MYACRCVCGYIKYTNVCVHAYTHINKCTRTHHCIRPTESGFEYVCMHVCLYTYTNLAISDCHDGTVMLPNRAFSSGNTRTISAFVQILISHPGSISRHRATRSNTAGDTILGSLRFGLVQEKCNFRGTWGLPKAGGGTESEEIHLMSLGLYVPEKRGHVCFRYV